MTRIPDRGSNVSPLLDAGLLLAARRSFRRHGLEHPTAAAILEATGAGRTRAYELAAEVTALLPGLERPVGRPRNPCEATDDSNTSPATSAPLLQDEVLDYLMANPGCVSRLERHRYSHGFRHFVVQLRERYPTMPLSPFANAVHVPAKTLQGWIRDVAQALEPKPRMGRLHDSTPEPENQPIQKDQAPTLQPGIRTPSRHALVEPGGQDMPDSGAPLAPEPVTDLRIQTILSEYREWKGSFADFCKHLRDHCCIEYGRTTISTILGREGLRAPRRRPGRSPDEIALRNAFETFFPGAQWVGDGHELAFELNGETHKVNLELCVDADSAAAVGAHVSPQEDSNAVVHAFDDGVATTGKPPLAFLLDNRASNHTPDVEAAVGESLLIRSTPGRAQNKAHAEGAFGLFQQTAPPLQINADTPRDLVAEIVAIIVMVWARTLNGKKRPAHGNRSRIELYQQAQPTPEQIEKAQAALEERQRKQEKARQTQLARQDPRKRDLLEKAFRDLELNDPDGNVQLAIARYPFDAIVDGVAIHTAKKAAQTLPESAGARYLLGIVKNVSVHNEQRHLVDKLLRLRLEARDRLLDHLVTECQVLQRAEPHTTARIDLFIDRALPTDSLMTRLFWLRTTAEQIRATPEANRPELVRRAAARITTNYRIPAATRQQAICYLTALVCPIE